MARPVSISPDLAREERQLLDRLLGLYEEELRLYGEVLSISRRQGDAIGSGRSLGEVRRLLQDKKRRLEAIGRLESSEGLAKNRWREGRDQWSAASRASLHRALQDVGQLIEDILQCEEENDRVLLEHAR